MSDPIQPQPVKPGYQTTEFYLTLAGEVVAVLLASDVIPSGQATKLVVLGGAMISRVLYVMGRFRAKRND